jgi:exonuclease SbcC
MRPIRLEVEGLTAFRERQSIEFEALDLFAISGPTGSGKTSLLDAITYALFGSIDRVGKQAAQFISQGQPRLSVLLEFAVGEERYRVTRTALAKGQTRILLEAWNGSEWEQAGEGSDRVTIVNDRIAEAIGLDYDAFTRTVLLPQGKFAQFLVGDAKKRREILTELLGLDLFGRLAKRAGDIKRGEQLEADTRAQLLEREYQGVTPDAVAAAERNAKEAAEADARLAEVETAVRALEGRWSETERSVDELRRAAAEASTIAARVAEAADALAEVGSELVDAESALVGETRAATEASRRSDQAVEALRAARERWGSGAELGALLARAESFAERRTSAAGVEDEVRAAGEALPSFESALAAAEQVLTTAVADAEAAIVALADAQEAEEAAAHADHVSAVRAAIKPGDDCPVCGAHVVALPKTRGASTIEKARAARAKAEEAARDAERRMRDASAERDLADRRLADARAEAARIQREAERERSELAKAEKELAGAFGGELPPDAAGEIRARVERLEALGDACDAAAADARAASERVAAAEREVARLGTLVAELRATLDALPVAAVQERARTLLGAKPVVPRRPARKDPAALRTYAGELAAALASLGEDLLGAADGRAADAATLLEEAVGVTGGLVPPAPTFADLVRSVSAAGTEAARAAATAEHRAEDLRTKLANAERIVEEAAEHRARASLFDTLSRELDARHVIPFLQAEALQLLAAAGSRRLETLSGGRYRLEHVEEEFSVVDTWNGEERRSVRTLSGGEMFLASLALALGLSEQVRALAVSDRARLDALFLDEGFGTLDPESLEIVVDAIEQLGGDGRMVGVITHVQELALRLPARIEIEKSPRGSRLRVVS